MTLSNYLHVVGHNFIKTMFLELFDVKKRSQSYFKKPRLYTLPFFEGCDIFLVLGGALCKHLDEFHKFDFKIFPTKKNWRQFLRNFSINGNTRFTLAESDPYLWMVNAGSVIK